MDAGDDEAVPAVDAASLIAPHALEKASRAESGIAYWTSPTAVALCMANSKMLRK